MIIHSIEMNVFTDEMVSPRNLFVSVWSWNALDPPFRKELCNLSKNFQIYHHFDTNLRLYGCTLLSQ